MRRQVLTACNENWIFPIEYSADFSIIYSFSQEGRTLLNSAEASKTSMNINWLAIFDYFLQTTIDQMNVVS